MKILHVLYSGLGGHGNVFFSMVSADAENKYEALFYGVEEVRNDFIEQCEKNNIPWYFAKKNFKLDLKYYRRIGQCIKKSDPDVIFLHGSAHILHARIANIFKKKKSRIIIRETQANHLKTTAQWISLATAMFMANHIVCLTEEFKKEIQKKLGWLYKEKKVDVISNGINLNIYCPREKTSRKAIFIGMQSRLVKIKDHLTLLKAFALLKRMPADYAPGLKLKIAGDGEYKEELVKYANELGIAEDVEFTGMISEKDLVTFLQNLDVYVHASFGETMSTAIMQAMACKLPVVASDVSGINNMITNNVTGLLVLPQNESELFGAIQQCIINPYLRELLAQNAFNYAQANFSTQKMMASYKNIFL